MGAPRQTQRTPAKPSENQQITMAERAAQIMTGIRNHRDDIVAVLPSTITWEGFLAVITTAMRHNPDILKCTTASIIKASCQCAYDGLLPDGKLAAFVPQRVKVKVQGQPDKYEWQVRYNPMVAGLIQQMIDTGLVHHAHATLVYKDEPYKVIRGTSESIEHEEIPELRGPGLPIRAVYCVATFKEGPPKFETMSIADVAAVRAKAATDYVWNANEGEMTRKTVVRRLRKSISGGSRIPDAEAMTMFPQFGAQPDARALPAPPAPDRRDFRRGDQGQGQIEHQQEVRVDAFADFDNMAGQVFAEGNEADTEQRPKRKAAKPAHAQPAEIATDDGGDGREKPHSNPDKKADTASAGAKAETAEPDDWVIWLSDTEAAIRKLRSNDEITEYQRDIEQMLAKAPAAIVESIRTAIQDARTELMGGQG